MKNWKSRLEVRDCDERGRGLFARTAIDEETVVNEIFGKIIDDPDYESDYCVDMSDDVKMEPGEPFCFLNHSCKPNCELVLWQSQRFGRRRIPRLWLQTIRPIQPGEEMTIDYAWPADAAIRCRCESVACRGWIVSEAELDEVLRRAATTV